MKRPFSPGITLVVLVFSLLLYIDQCTAEIIKYQDGDGKIHFTSDRDRIPPGAKILSVYETDQSSKDEAEEGKIELQQPQRHPPREERSARDGIIIRVLQDIVKVYQATHTYSKSDFYVCADMSLDVWNMVETKGINARIAVGNVQNPHAEWDQFNHAWVMAEATPDSWLALETTGGVVVRGDENGRYYRGLFFDTPRDFKEYVDLRKRRRTLSLKIKDLKGDLTKVKEDYGRELGKHNDLTDEYNRTYSDKRLSKSRFKKSMEFRDRINEQAMLVKELEGRGRQLAGIINGNIEELNAIDRQLTRPIERLNAN
jgi:hypothetical protein